MSRFGKLPGPLDMIPSEVRQDMVAVRAAAAELRASVELERSSMADHYDDVLTNLWRLATALEKLLESVPP